LLFGLCVAAPLVAAMVFIGSRALILGLSVHLESDDP
jgi:hypothetical protein